MISRPLCLPDRMPPDRMATTMLPEVARGFFEVASSVTGRRLGCLDDRAPLFRRYDVRLEIRPSGSPVASSREKAPDRRAPFDKADLLGLSACGLEALHEAELDLNLDLFELGNRDRLADDPRARDRASQDLRAVFPGRAVA